MNNIKQIILFLLTYLKVFFFFPLRFIPIKRGKIAINNYYGKGYGDNGKYILNELNKKLYKGELVWLVKKIDDVCIEEFPDNVKLVKYNSIKAYYHLYTAQFWISNVRLDQSFYKKKNQFYIQTWHGFGPKRIEKDVEKNLSKFYISNAKYDSKICDMLVSNSKKLTSIYKQCFWYEGDILEVNSPRNTVFLSKDFENQKVSILNKYKLSEDYSYLLYAPTFRKNKTLNNYYLDFLILIQTLEKNFKGKWKVLIRLHPNISSLSQDLDIFNDNVIDMSKSCDMQELLLIADALITDYSSSITDYLLLNKPSFIYAPDINEYKKDRNFYFDLNSITGTVSTNEFELWNAIQNFNYELYQKNIDIFKNKNGMILDKDGAEIIADLIISKKWEAEKK